MELTSKQRAYLRGLANPLPAIFQVGKAGVTDELIEQLSLALEARELIKLTVLENAPQGARETANALQLPLRAEVVQCIGRKVVLYRRNPEQTTITLPK